ncbi:hypothetical protein NQ176_g10280 [Zarea fungicola]|uniref:Uncharacterized protein n=1 Tax=Zarea fungicola TaxID=93591 RepID=A0ACC1MIR5_9HYPO|nr:hypothetical protein NQ176_g10280 [Lecanicillium fungicola]
MVVVPPPATGTAVASCWPAVTVRVTGDLLVDGGGLGVVARVGPDDDDFGARVDGDAAALHAVEESNRTAVELGLHGGARVGAHGVDTAKSAARGHCERRDGHGDGC